MTLSRKRIPRVSRITFEGMDAARKWVALERQLNDYLEVLQDDTVQVPTKEFSVDPVDGELLLRDGALWIASGGSYHQVWP